MKTSLVPMFASIMAYAFSFFLLGKLQRRSRLAGQGAPEKEKDIAGDNVDDVNVVLAAAVGRHILRFLETVDQELRIVGKSLPCWIRPTSRSR